MESSLIADRIRYLMNVKKVEEKELAKMLNISHATMKKKLNGKSKFYVDEVMKIKEIFDLDTDIFSDMFFNSEIKTREILSKK